MKNETPNPPENKDLLDQLLLEADGYVPDNGFTARVMTSLPARRKHSWRRFLVLSTAMLIGAGLVAWQLPAVFTIFSTIPAHWSAFNWQSLAVFIPLLAALISIGWAVFALTNEEE